MESPKTCHWTASLHTLNYVFSTCGQGIKLKGQDKLVLQAYSNSDWGSSIDTRKSITGYIMMLGNSPISWKSKKQQIVFRSSSKAECRAMASVASKITWSTRLLEELNVFIHKLITLLCDNQSTIFIGKNPVLHERTKHIEIDIYFIREKVAHSHVYVFYVYVFKCLLLILFLNFREISTFVNISFPLVVY